MSFIQLAQILSQLAPVVLIGAFFLGCFYRKFIDGLHKSLVIYLSLMLFMELIGRVLEYVLGNNIILLPVFSLTEMLFFIYFYNKYLLSKPSKILIWLGICGVLYIVIEALQYFVLNTLDIKQFQPYAKVVDNFVVIIMALYFFYQKMNNFKETKWGNFKLNIAIFIFFTSNTMIFLPFNFLVNESSGVKFYFWIVNVALLLLFYIYLTSLVYKNGTLNKNR